MATPERPPRLPRSPWRRHPWHDPALRRLAEAAAALGTRMQLSRSQAYRANFRRLHGVSFAEGQRMARALGLKGSPAAAVRQAAGSEAGVRLASYRGPNPRRLALAEAATRAQDRRRRELDALGQVRRGEADVARAERNAGLPRGSLKRTFGPGVDQGSSGSVGAVLNVLGPGGSVPVLLTSLEERQLVMAHYLAVQAALDGRPNSLQMFRGKSVGNVPLETNLARLRALSEAGLIEAPYPEARR